MLPPSPSSINSIAPSPYAKTGGLAFATVLILGFVKIFIPSAPNPVPSAKPVSLPSSSAPAGPTQNEYPAELAGKIRQSFGCVDSGAPAPNPETAHWNVPDSSRDLVHFVVAFEPDPVRTHLALLFDRDVEALELAVQQSGTFVFDRAVLPWQLSAHKSTDSSEAALADSRRRLEREQYPGLLIFHKNGIAPASAGLEPWKNCPARETLFIFLVAETPTSGIRSQQFQNALRIMWGIRNDSVESAKKKPFTAEPLLLLGPNFSGSLDSLSRQLDQIPPNRFFSRVVAYSGTITGTKAKDSFLAHFSSPNAIKVEFSSFQENDDYAIQMFASFLHDRGYIPDEIAILSEADTVYGNQKYEPSSGSADVSCVPQILSCKDAASDNLPPTEDRIVHLYFPREISYFRSAYQKEMAAQALSAPKIPGGKSPLASEPDEEATDDDAVAPFAGGQTSQSQEAVMQGIVTELQKHHIKFTVVLATNPVDELFLARYLRSNYPQGRIVVTSPDLLLADQEDTLLYGVLGVNDYSLIPALGDSLCQPDGSSKAHSDLLFDSSTSVGIYNAALSLLMTPSAASGGTSAAGVPLSSRPALADYGSPDYYSKDSTGRTCSPHPLLWLTILGRDGYWPIAAFSPASITSYTHALPIVYAPEIWAHQTSLPNARTSVSPPPMKVLHTRPAWNIAYSLCLALMIFHACLSFTGTFLANSESKAQFARTHDGYGVAVLALGSFGLTAFFVLLMCARSPLVCWNGSNYFPITPLLWSPLVVFVLVTCYDYARLRNQPYIAISFFAAVVLMTLFQVLLASDAFKSLPFLWSNRLIHLTSGVSPVLPFLLLFATVYWWSWLGLRAVSIVDLRRPRLPGVCHLPPTAVRISDLEGEKVRRTAHPLKIGWRIVAILLALALVSLTALEWRHPLQSLEGSSYDWGFSAGLGIGIAVFLSCLMRLIFTWFDYKQVLSGLDRSPLREAFSRMTRLSWRSMWNPGGSTLRETYRVMSRTLENMSRLKKILADSGPEKHADVLADIGATEDKLDDVLNEYHALFPQTCDEEDPAALIRQVEATHLQIAQTVSHYALVFPEAPQPHEIHSLPVHQTFEHIKSVQGKFSSNLQKYKEAFTSAQKLRQEALDAAKRAAGAKSFLLRLRHFFAKFRLHISPARKFQSDPQRAAEVMRQIKKAHDSLQRAVSDHKPLRAAGTPEAAILSDAHASLVQIKNAQRKLVAALDRWAALFPDSGPSHARGKILSNLTYALEEMQKQLANTAGRVFTLILTPEWTTEPLPAVSEDARLDKPKLKMARVIEEEFVALVYVNFLQSVLLQMRTLVVCACGMYVLLLCSMSVYPFEPHLGLQILAVVLLVVLAASVGFVYKEMHSDSILGRLTSSKGELGWDFWMKFISAGAIPVFSLLAVQFPEIGRFLFSWLEPALQAFK